MTSGGIFTSIFGCFVLCNLEVDTSCKYWTGPNTGHCKRKDPGTEEGCTEEFEEMDHAGKVRGTQRRLEWGEGVQGVGDRRHAVRGE